MKKTIPKKIIFTAISFFLIGNFYSHLMHKNNINAISELQKKNANLTKELKIEKNRPPVYTTSKNKTAQPLINTASENKPEQLPETMPEIATMMEPIAEQINGAISNTIKSKELHHWLVNTASNLPYEERLKMQFDSDPIDIPWAEQQEQTIAELLATRPEFSDTAIKSTQCRSNFCQITLAISTPQQANQILGNLSKAFAGKEPTMVIATQTPEKAEATFYIAKNIGSFEFN